MCTVFLEQNFFFQTQDKLPPYTHRSVSFESQNMRKKMIFLTAESIEKHYKTRENQIKQVNVQCEYECGRQHP